MSLLDDVSIVVTPNGYKAGELYAVIPVPTEGSELVDNGDFANGETDWTFSSQCEVVNDQARILSTDGSFQYISQNNVFDTSKNYKLEFDVISSNGATLGFAGGISDVQTTTLGRKTIYTSPSTTYLQIKRSSGVTDVVIDNISVKEYTSADMDVTRATAATRVDENGLIEDVLDNVPRIDYTGGGCPHILAEPQRTNLVTDSESYTGYFNNSGTLIYNNTTSPDGLENGAKNYASTTGSFKGLSKSYGSTLNNTAYTLSIFAKAGEFDDLYFYNIGAPSGNGGVWFNLSTGNVGTTSASWSSAKMESFGNGWYRCSAVITPSGTSDNLYILLADANNSVTATANGTDGYYIYGASLEEGSYATSYIPTSGSTVTRNQDIFTRDGIGSLINSTEGVLFVEMAALSNDLSYRYITLSDGTNSNYVIIRYYNNSNRISAYLVNSAGTQGSTAFTVSDITSFSKIAFKWKASDFALWVDGEERSVQSSGTTFSSGVLNSLYFSEADGSGNTFYGKVKQLQVYDTSLSDTQLAALTS